MQMHSSKLTNPVVVALGALLCCALWGSASPFIKIGYALVLPEQNIPSTLLFAGLRFTMAGILTILLYSIAGKRFLFPKKENFPRIMKLSAFQTVIQYIFFYIGLANTTSVKGTVASGCNAFFSILAASLIFRQEKLTARKIVACLIGFSGIVLINLNGLDLNMNFFGDGFVILSSACYGISSALIKRYSKYEEPVILSGYQFVIGGAFMIVVSLIAGGRVRLETPAAIGVLLYLAMLSAIAYSLWGILLEHNSVSKVTVFSFMIPVFGVIFSTLLLREASNVPTLNLIVTLVMICAGIILLNYQKPAPADKG